MSEIDKLKFWVDTEFTIVHILLYVVIGLLLHSTTGWVVCGVLIFISVLYTFKRIALLPKNYLSTKGVKSERNQ